MRYNPQYSLGIIMPLPRNPDARLLTLGGERAVNFTIRLPLSLALRVEDHLHSLMRKNLVETGSRAEASVASLFRAAIEHYMVCPETMLIERPRRGRPPKLAPETPEEPKPRRGRPPKSDSDQPKQAKPKKERPPKVAPDSAEEPKPKRGRPPKGASGHSKKAKPKKGQPPAKPFKPRKPKAD